MSEVITQQIECQPSLSIQRGPKISVRNKSPQNEKLSMIQKIEVLMHNNNQLEVKQESLKNSIYDLRKLIELGRKQGEEALQYLHSQISKAQSRTEGSKAALKYVHKDGNHLQRCMLFWEEFL